jgi:C1A family cysteine protease
MEGSPKELFKVFHYVFEKPYDLNSEIAIAKYRVFKKNLSYIKEHNSKGLSWTLEVNTFADMSDEEVNSYMGLGKIPTTEEKNVKSFDLFDELVDKEENSQKRKLSEVSFFDQFADKEDSDGPVPPSNKKVNQNDSFPDIDYTDYLTPARNQGGCGSCWAFSTAAAIESNYNFLRNKKLVKQEGYISPQAIIDCNPLKAGCNGGWMHNAINHVGTSGAVLEKDYPYKAVQSTTCKAAPKIEDLKFQSQLSFYEGCAWISYFKLPQKCSKNYFYSLLSRGPLSVVLMAERNFSAYRSGIIDASLISQCNSYNHAVLAYAWLNVVDVNNNPRQVIKIRNSWGPYWGENGSIKYYYDDNGTCFITKLALRPLLA